MEVTQLPIHKRIRKAVDEFNDSEYGFDPKAIRKSLKPNQERMDYLDFLANKYQFKTETLLKILLCTK